MNDRVNKSKHNLNDFHLHEYHNKKREYTCTLLLKYWLFSKFATPVNDLCTVSSYGIYH